MTTIKSHTDIPQSKKLAKFLPLESADMYWYLATKGNPVAGFNEGYNKYGDFELPCWSLSALLSVLPKIHGVKPILDLEENSIQYTGIDLYVVADNPVDACVAMIIKLHELKKL